MATDPLSPQTKVRTADNLLLLAFNGVLTKQKLDKLYTEVRFGVADLKSGFQVISDFSNCQYMYLNGLPTFRRIIHYILKMECGEIIRVIQSDRMITKQLIHLSMVSQGYKPSYTNTVEEAEKKLQEHSKRAGLRFQFDKVEVGIRGRGEEVIGTMMNISLGGCAVNCAVDLFDVGETLHIAFAMKTGKQHRAFQLTGEVVRKQEQSIALCFKDIDSQAKEQLWECLLEGNNDR